MSSPVEHIPSGGPDDGHGVLARRASGPQEDHGQAPGEVAVAHTGAVVSYNPDAPSEEWGWHGHWSQFAPRGRYLLLGTGVVGLLLMVLVGNQQSHVENYFLVVVALLMSLWMWRTLQLRKRERRTRP